MEAWVQPYLRVVVPFGKKRYYTAIVKAVYDDIPQTTYALKAIFATLDKPIMLASQMTFWEWMASYYLCKLGDVYKAAVPSGLRMESETAVYYNPHPVEKKQPLMLTHKEQLIIDAFSGEARRLTVSQLEKSTRINNAIPLLHRLMQQGFVTVSEELKKGFAPKKETYVRLHPDFYSEASVMQMLTQLKRAKEQEKALLTCIRLAGPLLPDTPVREITKKHLLETSGVSVAVLDSLVKRGCMAYYEKEVSRIQPPDALQPLHILTQQQQTVFDDVKNAFKSKQVCLLHGVPSCGKTEIYIHLASEMLEQGKQVLYLLPEIALTTHLTERLRTAFGEKLWVYHSGLSDAMRVEIWNTLLHRQAPVVVLGVRSSLFLPFNRLGLVIVDEEHESSYKQSEPAPRYHARNAAVMLANICNAKTLLGSGTPSLESLYNTMSGKYGLVKLNARYGQGLTPQIHLVDTKELKRKRIMKDNLVSPLLQQKINEALQQDEQVILFRNRRGFAPVIECRSCGKSVSCIHCDVSLTYHKQPNRLICHYCGHTALLPVQCPACGQTEMKQAGFGTEQIEEEVATLFPHARIARLDLDAAHTHRDYERILTHVRQGKIQILIGTQMVSKGLDFERVTVVGVLNADSLMNVPDFRAHERAFQLMMQVSGRSGRRHKQGAVVIQTAQPEHPLLQWLQAENYDAMATEQLNERYLFQYPPYSRLITIVLRSKNVAAMDEHAATCARLLKKTLGEAAVYGPFAPPVNRIQSLYVRNILLKIKLSQRTSDVRAALDKLHRRMQQLPTAGQIRLHYDVDN